MYRYFSIILVALFCIVLGASLPVWADEAADVQMIKGLLTGEEEAEWAGNVEKVMSYFSSDAYMCMPNEDAAYSSGNNVIIDPVKFEIAGSGPDDVRKYAENWRTNPDYLKKNPGFKHRNIVEQVNIRGDMAIAVDKRIREWTDDKTNEYVRHTMRNLWTMKKIKGEWKLTGCFAHFSRSLQAFKMRPPR
jgi:ketosteroid isomerase-like protein